MQRRHKQSLIRYSEKVVLTFISEDYIIYFRISKVSKLLL